MAAACCATKPWTTGRPPSSDGKRLTSSAAACSATGPPPEWPPTASRLESMRPRSWAGSAEYMSAPLRTNETTLSMKAGVITLVFASCTPRTRIPCEAMW